MARRKRNKAPPLRRTALMGDDLKPRDYQVELVEKALKENGIIFMPTGSGKTFVASLLIKELGGTILTKDFEEGGKRTFFLVNTVQLVTQQALCVLNQTPFSVGRYSGDMNVDYWTKEKWLEEMKNEVLVMTAQIFLNLLLHNLIQFCNVNLMILDECHHARNNHAMAQIMKLFKAYEKERPHVLGLTATLLNANVKNIDSVDKEISSLESTLSARILTPSDSEVVQRFSTNPIEKIILYAEENSTHPIQQVVNSLTEALEDQARDVKMPDRNETPVEIIENAKLMNRKRSWSDHVKNMLKQIREVGNDLGAYAASKCVLALIVRYERMKLHASEIEVILLLNYQVTKLHLLRKYLEDAMSHYEIGERPLQFATPKMKELINILQNMKKEDSVLVFVKLRFTAKVLYYVFDELVRNNNAFSHVKPDFIVGFNHNPMNDVKEMMYEKKANAQTLERFNSKVSNVLFASDVIEEGTDISHCNYVVKFDRLETVRSYVQSKGRARHKDSLYYVFCKVDPKNSEVNTYKSYQEIERKLADLLKRSIRSTDLGVFESDPIEPFAPFGPNGPKVTVYSAISLINRYTTMLPQDKFANLASFWWSRQHREKGVCGILQLPINSAVKDRIEGPYCNNEADAKRAAALVACQKLFEAGELDSQLLPRGDDSDALHDQEIFFLWPEQEPKGAHKAGTTKRLQLYRMNCPRWVFGCQPRSGVELYLHVLFMKPVFKTHGNARLEAFKNHLGSRQQFAMLSTKPLTKITEFTLFMHMGEVDIDIVEASERVVLSEEELKKAFEFHTLLFTEVLTMGKKFFVRDHDNADNSYWVVPVLAEKPQDAKIDWDTIENYKSLPEIKPVSSDERSTWRIKGSDYIGKVVVPWYRGSGGLPSVRYIVTKVCEGETPFSPFPSETYSTYSEYFHLRYGERVVNSNQPLIQVRAISSKINCLKPRGTYKASSRSKREEGDLEETLIPELCILIEFPAAYILKATLLPSLLHRVHHLLGAEELRRKIVLDSKLGLLEPPGGTWKRLSVDSFAVQPEEEPAAKSTIGVSNLLNEKMEALSASLYPWKPEDEPTDIEKQLNTVDLLSIIHYNKFLVSDKKDNYDLEGFMRTQLVNECQKEEIPSAVPLSVLEVNTATSPGPQISEILPAITSIRANDIVNYERLETLGDSFLKFAVSLSLFLNYPEMDEGKLTQIKGKIIGNRNLYYCGRNLGLGERLKARDFTPDEWNLPSFCVVPTLKELLSTNHLSPHPFYGIRLSKEEINSGLLSNESLSQANAVLNSLLTDESEAHSKANSYSLLQLGLQPVSDKVIADAVEALLGVYLQTCGIRGALRLAKYMGILPGKLSDVSALLDAPPPSASRVKENILRLTLNMFKANEIEKILDYKFKDKSYLLQAFTHSSATHFATDCYQRLEFLGDAILDFLITMHIYDSCGKLSPGELTDLRSALVNNITFSCLAVKYNFHKYLFSKAYSLTEAITNFAERQAKRGHAIGAEVSFLIEETDVSVAETVEVPKVLGDLFESVIAAVYLDSGKCLKTTWNVVYKLMYQEIKSFSQNVPKNNVRLLYEKFPNPVPTFGKSRLLEEGRVLVPLEVVQYGPNEPERRVFTGMGLTKAAAKMAAAKLALRHYHKKTES